MKLSHLILYAMFITGLISCSIVDKEENIVARTIEASLVKAPLSTADAADLPKITEGTNLSKLCPLELYVYHPVIPVPLITGTERAEPIVLMTRQEFNERIQLSPL